jgi:hypothetical protein
METLHENYVICAKNVIQIQEIIDNIQDTVEILKIIKPIYNFKSKN